MQKFIARMNIERFRSLIAAEPEGASRDRLERMLADEEAKLRSHEARGGSSPSQDQAGGTSEAR